MSAPNGPPPARFRIPSWAGRVLVAALCVLAVERGWHLLRHKPRLWNELLAFTAAFGGFIGVAILLGVGVAVLVVADAVFFRDERGGGRKSDGG